MLLEDKEVKGKHIAKCYVLFIMLRVRRMNMIRDLLIKLLALLVEEPKVVTSDVVTRTLFKKYEESDTEMLTELDVIKGDYYFKGKDTGNWKMITNEDTAIEDKLFVVTIISYENDNKSIEYANRFANHLETWFKFTELKNDWTTEN